LSVEAERPTWTGRLRVWAVGVLPPERLLPDTQPVSLALICSPFIPGIRSLPR
jgi:hypothetical protein